MSDERRHVCFDTRRGRACVAHQFVLVSPKNNYGVRWQLLEEVQRFLGVGVRVLHSQQVKIHTKSLKQQVGNWEEVFRTLNGTQFQDFVTEDAQVPET